MSNTFDLKISKNDVEIVCNDKGNFQRPSLMPIKVNNCEIGLFSAVLKECFISSFSTSYNEENKQIYLDIILHYESKNGGRNCMTAFDCIYDGSKNEWTFHNAGDDYNTKETIGA